MTLNMFKDLLEHPQESPESFERYVALLRVLCGKSRSESRPADYVLEMILCESDGAEDGPHADPKLGQIPGGMSRDSSSSSFGSGALVQQLLGRYLVLMTQLVEGTLEDQSSFDLLANLIVIFSKIIKQGPAGNVERLGVALLELLQRGPGRLCFVSDVDFHLATATFAVQGQAAPSIALIDLFLRTMHAFWAINPEASRGVLKHVLDAITSMFSEGSLEDRRRILARMQGG